jgi:hypothetical protein
MIAETLIYANRTSGTLPASDFSLDWLTLPMPEDGDFLELMLLYQCHGKFTKEYDQLLIVFFAWSENKTNKQKKAKTKIKTNTTTTKTRNNNTTK